MNEKTLLAHSAEALKMLINEEIYWVKEKNRIQNFEYSGENNKYLLILVNRPLKNEERDFLYQILKAVNYDLKDFALVDHSKYLHTDLRSFKQFFSMSRLMCFGVSPEDLHLTGDYADYQYIPSDECGMLFCPVELSELNKKKELKASLWSGMQQMFNIKK